MVDTRILVISVCIYMKAMVQSEFEENRGRENKEARRRRGWEGGRVGSSEG